MRYIPHTEADIRAMLDTIGAPDVEALFATIPRELRAPGIAGIPPALSEHAVMAHMEALAAQNAAGQGFASFLGAGAYAHFIPQAESQLLLRQEFFTSYTPYQPEISQGTLQAVFEFQTYVCAVTGMEVANASMYDGASAVAEAALMALRVVPGRTHIAVARSLHPEYRQVMRTYLSGVPVTIEEIPLDARTGAVDVAAAAQVVTEKTAALVVQHPNFLGCAEDVAALVNLAHGHGAQYIAAFAEPLAFALWQPPGALGADIAAGEGQSFGVPMTYGGPMLGMFATREKYLRQMPGRLVGMTVDSRGDRGFTVTLSTREQHIRREKATSNICTNTGLNATAAAIWLSLAGREGIEALARDNLARAAYLREGLAPYAEMPFTAPVFNEFTWRPKAGAAKVLAHLAKQNVLGGLPLGRYYPELEGAILTCVTEMAAKADLDRYVVAVAEVSR